MQYIDVQWFHESTQHPIRLASELDDERFERRKLEFFQDGKVSAANREHSSGDTRLGEAPVPTLEKINHDPQFRAEITGEEFELLWDKHAEGLDHRPLVVHLEGPYPEYQSVASVRDVVLAGLTWPTDYWAGLAIGWLEQGAPLDAGVIVALNQVAQKKHFAQSIRHRAFSLAKRWEREQNGASEETPR